MSRFKLDRIAFAPILLAAALIAGRAALAHDEAPPAGASGVKGELLMWIEDAQDKLIQLAEAMPESKYGWAPDKGVRTVGEVFMHVSAANYGVPSFIGIPAPAGFDFGTYEHSLTKKSDIVKSLKDSFAHVESRIVRIFAWCTSKGVRDIHGSPDQRGLRPKGGRANRRRCAR